MPTRSELLVGWLVVFSASLTLLAGVVLVAWGQRYRNRRRTERVKRTPQAEAARHAAEVATRAAQATAHATEARQRASQAQEERSAAWHELEQARQAHDQAARRYQEEASQKAEHLADGDGQGQRELARAAFSAYQRGELSRDEFWWVWRLGNGRDPELERQEKDLRRLRTAWHEAHLRYRAAVKRAREAAREAEVAEVEARALVEETAEAAREADVTR